MVRLICASCWSSCENSVTKYSCPRVQISYTQTAKLRSELRRASIPIKFLIKFLSLELRVLLLSFPPCENSTGLIFER